MFEVTEPKPELRASKHLHCVRGVKHVARQFILYGLFTERGGTRWRSWLRHWVTSRKVAGSIPDGVVGIFHWHNPSGRTVALGLTQPLTEMSYRSISCG